MFGEDDIVKSHKGRADVIFRIILISFGILMSRLWYLQIYQGDYLRQVSIQNRLRKEVVKAPRGMIFSRNNELLVYNVPRFDAVIIPQFLSNKSETIAKLSQILDISQEIIVNALKKKNTQASYLPVVIKKNISRKEVAVIETENSKMPGVFVNTFISREYTDKEVGAHLLGYTSEISQSKLPRYQKRDKYNYKPGDFIGKKGLEEKFDLELRGDDGEQFMEVDASGRMKRLIQSDNIFAGIKNRSAKPGNNIRLTIDRDMQLVAYKAMEGKAGSLVAVDVKTGEILAMVSLPSFDPGQFSRKVSPKEWEELTGNESYTPLLDRSIQEHYAPGSTFKTIAAIAALEQNIVKPDQEVMCKGSFLFGGRTYNDWKKDGHGMTDIYKSLRRSVDVYYYKIATQIDIDVLSDYAKSLGFGSRTGIDLPSEVPGLIPTKEWKLKLTGEPWQKGETLSCIIGQSFVAVTPLQLAMAYSAVANGGTLYRPLVIKEIFSNSGQIIRKFAPEVTGKLIVKPQNLNAVKQGLFQVVNHERGTAFGARGKGIRMAGKSGTAQVRRMTKKELFSQCTDMPYDDRHHALFVGFAPFDNPGVAVAAVVEHGCGGSSTVAPIVRDVVTKYMEKYRPAEHERYIQEDKETYKLWLKGYLERKKAEEEGQKKVGGDET